MKNKLEYLFALQLIDTDLDSLQEQKGDLPFEVEALENELAALRARLAAAEGAMRQAFSMRDNADNEIVTLREKLDKYKGQQFSVRSNREYDALTREMDADPRLGYALSMRLLERTYERLARARMQHLDLYR